MTTLTVTPDSYDFAANDLRDLKDTLSELDRVTIVTPASSINDICLNAETGRTGTGFAYSATALVQMCGLLAPGLAQLVNDLCGQWRKPGENMRFFSDALAVELFNRIARLRFDRKLIGLQLVRNNKTRVIDGLVGSKYRYLANSDFLERTVQTMIRLKANFHQAFLYGRQLVVRYSHSKDTAFNLAGEPYTFGYHFANSEIGGKSVRGAGLLINNLNGNSALAPFTGRDGGRVVHSGRDFEKKLHILLDIVVRNLPSKAKLIEDASTLDKHNLKMTAEHYEKECRRLAMVLVRRKLNLSFAKRVVSSTASMGRDNNASLVDTLSHEASLALAERTAYDLFAALIREACMLPIDQRETAEQCAYALLTGKVSI